MNHAIAIHMRLPLFYRKKIIWIMTLFSVAILAAFYIFQVNSLTALVYHVADQERKIQQLKEDNASLQIHAQQPLSIKDLETLARQLDFEKVRSISYVKVLGGSVAQTNIQE